MKKIETVVKNSIKTVRGRLIWLLSAGVLLGLAYPPWGLWLAVVPAFAALYIAVSAAASRREFVRLGFLFGFVFYLVHCYWFVSFHPFALPAALVYIALWHALWAFAMSYLTPNPFYYAAGWLGLEWLVGLGYLGFPWSRITTALAAQPFLIQPVAFSGELFWGALWALVGFGLGAMLLDFRRSKYFILTLLVLILFLIGGGYRLYEKEIDYSEDSVLIVQHNISSFPIRRGLFREQFRVLSSLTEDNARPGDLVIWPETSIGVPFGFDSTGRPDWPSNAMREGLLGFVPDGGALLTGVIFYDPVPDDLNMLNGAILLEEDGIGGFYSKRKPVPGGEHLPMMGRWDWVYKLGRLMGTHGYRSGKKGGIIQFEGERETEIALQICFEDAFPGFVRNQVQKGADLLVNISNDSWSRSRASHRQHLYRARLRAVETGRMMLRAGNTGFSEIIDPFGRPVALLDAYEAGILRGRIALPLPETLYLRFGGFLTLVGFFLLAGCGFFLRPKIT